MRVECLIFWSFLISNKSLLNFIKHRDELGWGIFHRGNVNCHRDSKIFENLYSSCKCEISTTPQIQTVFYVINNGEEVTFVSQVSIIAVVHNQCSNFVSIQIDPSTINGFVSFASSRTNSTCLRFFKVQFKGGKLAQMFHKC